jgi:hypothetical protein
MEFETSTTIITTTKKHIIIVILINIKINITRKQSKIQKWKILNIISISYIYNILNYSNVYSG